MFPDDDLNLHFLLFVDVTSFLFHDAACYIFSCRNFFFPPEQATELLISDMSTKYSVHQPNKQ